MIDADIEELNTYLKNVFEVLQKKDKTELINEIMTMKCDELHRQLRKQIPIFSDKEPDQILKKAIRHFQDLSGLSFAVDWTICKIVHPTFS